MKNGNENTRHKGRTCALTLIAMMLLAPVMANAQIRIDWQQCYGTQGGDEATSILPVEDGYFVFGSVLLKHTYDHGMATCEIESYLTTPWLIRIDRQGNLQDQSCWGWGRREDAISIRQAKTDNHEYYMNMHNYGEVTILKIDDGMNELWRREIGDYGCQMFPTDDGGVVVGNSYGMLDKTNGEDSLLKLDNQGNVIWKISSGMSIRNIIRANDGGFFLVGEPLDKGLALVKINEDGQREWERLHEFPYWSILELEDGFLMAGSTTLEGEGFHGNSDILLTRTDKEGNPQWSRYYGGSRYDTFYGIFANPNGGFTVFALANSSDGDVQSNNDDIQIFKLWIFHINDSGELLWERAIGSHVNNVFISSIAEIGDYKYVIAGSMIWEDPPTGDVNCSNSAEIPYPGQNYWVLQVTDTINSAGVPEPMTLEEVQVHPNPTTGQVTITGQDLKTAEVFNTLGQHVATAAGEGERLTVDLSGQPAGIYFVTITDEEGRKCVRKVVKE